MFFTYVFRELRRRHRQALLTALGLAVGVALVVAVTAYAGGVGKAQDEVLQSLYGVGTDITVSQQQKMDQGGPQRFGMQPPDAVQAGPEVQPLRGHDEPRASSRSPTKKLAQIAVAGRRRPPPPAASAMTVMQREGEVRPGAGRRRPAPMPAAGAQPRPAASSPQQGQAQMAPIDVSSLSVSGVDATDLEPRAPQLGAGQLRALAARAPTRTPRSPSSTKAYAKQNSLAVGDTKKIDGKKFEIVGIVALPAGSTSSDLYIPLSSGAEAQRQRGQGQPDLREGRQRRRHRRRQEGDQGRSCPRRP